jgi:hypothetical protein
VRRRVCPCYVRAILPSPPSLVALTRPLCLSISLSLSLSVCLCRRDVSVILQHLENIDVKSLLSAIQKTVEFESALANRFATMVEVDVRRSPLPSPTPHRAYTITSR